MSSTGWLRFSSLGSSLLSFRRFALSSYFHLPNMFQSILRSGVSHWVALRRARTTPGCWHVASSSAPWKPL
ncbi:hypothetical protein F4809DRAFT_625456 [Biscogniauxia mediterranea]|nr:hypothetical protein F4809DRAFT_625456 [Biscogniauxia mediterranea]